MSTDNAGIHGTQTFQPKVVDAAAYRKEYAKLTSEDFDKSLRVNTFGAYHVAIAFIELLAAARHCPVPANRFTPQIIFTTSMNSHSKDTATGGLSLPYMLSKSATAHLVKLLASELLPLEIRVNAIAPGHVSTGMSGGGLDELGRSKQISILDTKYFKVPLASKHYVRLFD